MEQGKLSLRESNGSLFLEKDGQKISIWQTLDQDIWFGTKEDEVCLELDFRAREFKERSVYGTFRNLMRMLVGRYMLEDANVEYSLLPSDFIDLENRVITWHSDSGNGCTLKLSYDDYVIRVTLSRGEKSKIGDNVVRVRTDGSEYMRYYQEFVEFFSELRESVHFQDFMKDANIDLDHIQGGEDKEAVSTPIVEESQTKKLSLKRLFRRPEKNDSK